MADAKVLSLPPLSSVEDPAVRSALQAVYNWMQVRDGQVRGGANKFLTEADASTTINKYFQAATTGVNYPPGANPGSVQTIIDSLARAVVNSVTYLDLIKRIDRIEAPSWLQSAITAAIGNVYTKVEVQAVRQGQAEAAIGRAVEAQATGERATVTAFNAMLAAFGINTSAIYTLDEVATTASGSYASTITQLQADVGTAQATAEQGFTLAQTVEGWTKASYYVKVDIDGYVSGFAFGVEGEDGYYTSDFIVTADTFAIAAPGLGTGDPVVPFIVKTSSWTDDEGVTQPAGVYAQNLTVRAANIGDGVVGGILESASYDEMAGTGWRLNPDGSAYFGGDVVIDGELTNAAFETGVSAAVTTGSVTLTPGNGYAASVTHGLGRHVIVTISPTVHWDGESGSEVARAITVSQTTSGFTVATTGPWNSIDIVVDYAYL